MNIMNYDHDYEHITIENIIKCLKISKEKREDAIASLGRFIRESDKNDRSVIVSNLRCKNVKAFEDGEYVTKDARTVIANDITNSKSITFMILIALYTGVIINL